MSILVDIKKSLGSFTLDVKFEAENEILALLGASGCGKSVTLKCIAGIIKPDEGRIVLNGKTLFDSRKKINLKPQQRRVGYLFQQYALFPNMTAKQNIAVGLRGRPKAERTHALEEKIKEFQLQGLEHKYPHQLSGGQQQRVALARILCTDPEIILLDEPFSALDQYLKWQLEMQLDDTIKKFSRTTIWVSHDRNEVYRNCDRICVLTSGKSSKPDTVKNIFSNPGSVSAAMLSGCKNYAKAQYQEKEATVFIPEWNLSLWCNSKVAGHVDHIGVRAHYVHLTQETGHNSFFCYVERIIEDVFSIIVMLRPEHARPNAPLLRMELEKHEWDYSITNGQRLQVHINPEDILLLSSE